MSKVTVELDYETIEKIIRDQMMDTRDGLMMDLERVKETRKGNIFDMDYKKDMKEIKKHIKACERIYKYYGGR